LSLPETEGEFSLFPILKFSTSFGFSENNVENRLTTKGICDIIIVENGTLINKQGEQSHPIRQSNPWRSQDGRGGESKQKRVEAGAGKNENA